MAVMQELEWFENNIKNALRYAGEEEVRAISLLKSAARTRIECEQLQAAVNRARKAGKKVMKVKE